MSMFLKELSGDKYLTENTCAIFSFQQSCRLDAINFVNKKLLQRWFYESFAKFLKVSF